MHKIAVTSIKINFKFNSNLKNSIEFQRKHILMILKSLEPMLQTYKEKKITIFKTTNLNNLTLVM